MKLKTIEFDGSSHRKVVDETGDNLGLFYLDPNGQYYFEPLTGRMYSSYLIQQIAKLLNEVNSETPLVFKTSNKLKIGDRVLVKNRGHNYSSYYSKFKELGFSNPDSNKWFDDLHQDRIFTIFNIGKHEEDGTKLYAIKDGKGNEYLFGKKGLNIAEGENFGVMDESTGVIY